MKQYIIILLTIFTLLSLYGCDKLDKIDKVDEMSKQLAQQQIELDRYNNDRNSISEYIKYTVYLAGSIIMLLLLKRFFTMALKLIKRG